MTETELDAAHRATAAAPDDAAARLGYYERLADTELLLLLAAEPDGDTVVPRIFALEEGDFALAFDLEERIADFAGAPVPYLALPGRAAARVLSAQGVGLAVNAGGSGRAQLLSAEALAWLASALDRAPEPGEGRPAGFIAPRDLPEALLAALRRRLSRLAGAAERAHLVGTVDAGGKTGLLLVFEGARARDERALAKAIAEAVTFSGADGRSLDVAFLSRGDPALAEVAAVAIRFDLSAAPRDDPGSGPRAAPGMDPARPPKLR